MKKILAAVVIVILIGAGVCTALQLTGTVNFSEFFAEDETEEEAAFYVSFMDDYFVMDEEGVVLKCTGIEPEGIPEIENMMFNSFTVGQVADAQSPSTLDYVIEVCSLLEVYSISAQSISVSDGEITLELDENFSVMLGENEDTDTKLKDLQSLYSKLYEYEGGVLYMKSADSNGQGYTFKETTQEETEEGSEEESAEEESE